MAGGNVNKVILIGRLGKDPDVRYTPDGKAVTNITLATSESWKDKNTGQKQERTEWHRVVFFGGIAGVAGEYLKKGSQVYIEGKLQTRKWQDQSGQDRYTTEIVVDGFNGSMEMLGSRGGTAEFGGASPQQAAQNQGGYQQQNAPAPAQNQQPQGQMPSSDNFDDDIPF